MTRPLQITQDSIKSYFLARGEELFPENEEDLNLLHFLARYAE
jgi:hypothetical protein